MRRREADAGHASTTRRRARLSSYCGRLRTAFVVKRLKALLPVLVPALERNGRLALDEVIRPKVMAMSAATIDRLLRDARSVGRRRRPRKTPTALRRSVSIRTFADWGEPAPGLMEMDLVAHYGDIASGWTECLPLLIRESSLGVEAVEGLRGSLPFRLCGLDVDNDGEFLNEALLRYCVNQGIELTRSRPYHKNDQAGIEQKNAAVVRRFVGYHRFEGPAAVEALARLYGASRLFVNFFQPSFKLKEKVRIGTRVIKRYHTPETPCARLLASGSISEQMKARLHDIAGQLDPLRLLDEIRMMQHQLVLLANGGEPHTALPQRDDLSRFLSSLPTAWRGADTASTLADATRPVQVGVADGVRLARSRSGSNWHRAVRTTAAREPKCFPRCTAAHPAAPLEEVAREHGSQARVRRT